MEGKQERPKTLLVSVIKETDPRADRIFENPKNNPIRRWAGKNVTVDVASTYLDGFMLTVVVTSTEGETMQGVRIETLSGLKYEGLEALFASAFDKRMSDLPRTARMPAVSNRTPAVRTAIAPAE